MSRVLVVDTRRWPLHPCTPARARLLLKQGKAAVLRRYPRTRAKVRSCVHGLRTGDIVRAVVTEGKKIGVYHGRVAVRTSGFFNVTTKTGTVQGVAARYCTAIHRADGYSYQKGGRCFFPIP